VKPKVFVGSSAEGLKIAEVVAAHVAADFDPRPWEKGLFLPGTYPLEALEDAIHECMFAIIVGTADDVLTKRGVAAPTIRDNLIFELGLFVGSLGRKRTILLIPAGVTLALPSDIYGLTPARYESREGPPTSKEWLDALQLATVDVTAALQRELARHVASEQERRSRLLQDRRRQAVQRLYRAVTQLRDLFIALPTEALAALGNKIRFDKVKRDASARVRRMREEWQEDAELLEVTVQLDALVRATCEAIENIPYPGIHVSEDEGKQVAGRLLQRGLAGGGIGDAFVGVAEQVSREVERKAEEFAQMYKSWWDRHSGELRQRANELQDALMSAVLA
jgi:hypothetical protein